MVTRAVVGLLLGGFMLPGHAADNPQPDGKALFQRHCVVCHGERADGQSKLGKLMQPQPANLTHSTLGAAERERIIRKGGAAMGRSSGMPAWELELKDSDITTLVAYVGTLINHARKTHEGNAVPMSLAADRKPR